MRAPKPDIDFANYVWPAEELSRFKDYVATPMPA
jgi:hypothetical protein